MASQATEPINTEPNTEPSTEPITEPNTGRSTEPFPDPLRMKIDCPRKNWSMRSQATEPSTEPEPSARTSDRTSARTSLPGSQPEPIYRTRAFCPNLCSNLCPNLYPDPSASLSTWTSSQASEPHNECPKNSNLHTNLFPKIVEQPKKKTKNRPKLASESVSRISSYYYISKWRYCHCNRKACALMSMYARMREWSFHNLDFSLPRKKILVKMQAGRVQWKPRAKRSTHSRLQQTKMIGRNSAGPVLCSRAVSRTCRGN